MIAFVGSVFSPYYKRARERGRSDPCAHCAINVALYGPRARWTMTERGAQALARSRSRLAIGPSGLAYEDGGLTISLRERGAPWPAPVRGIVRVEAPAVAGDAVVLDARGFHRWHPFAPCARVTVALDRPALRWSGPGYFDGNDGDEPLEDAFASWHWSRARVRNHTVISYDVARRDGGGTALAFRCGEDGTLARIDPMPVAALPASAWRIARRTRADGADARVVATLVDAPFYARSLVASRIQGEPALAIHESLSLDRFRAAWVRMLLPFRMPRAAGRRWVPASN